MWNLIPIVVVAAAGKSPAWQLRPGVEEDEVEEEEKVPILSTGSLLS